MDQMVTSLFFVFIVIQGTPNEVPIGPYDTYWGCDQQRIHVEETIMHSISLEEQTNYEIFCDRFRKN